MGTETPLDQADLVLLGVPFDGTSSFRPGSRFAPRVIRTWSDALETYSPLFDKDLEGIRYADLGDLQISPMDWNQVGPKVEEAVGDIVDMGKIPLILGGEHLLTMASVRACHSRYPDMAVLQMDAHLDLRDSYQGIHCSHATVMRRVYDLLGPGRLFQWGCRSGTREEWSWAKVEGTLVESPDCFADMLKDRPVYLTLDLDVLDPSVFPETGTPEPGGMMFNQLTEALMCLKGLPIAGADIVEFCPMAGDGSPSSAVAVKVVREVICLCDAGRQGLNGESNARSSG